MHERTDSSRDAAMSAIGVQADAVAAHLTDEAASFHDAIADGSAEYEALLRSIARLGPAYTFDRGGRPLAIEAVRRALPAVERELFDAILDDFACERAAVEEGLYRVALAYGRRRRSVPAESRPT